MPNLCHSCATHGDFFKVMCRIHPGEKSLLIQACAGQRDARMNRNVFGSIRGWGAMPELRNADCQSQVGHGCADHILVSSVPTSWLVEGLVVPLVLRPPDARRSAGVELPELVEGRTTRHLRRPQDSPAAHLD
jgi:hypothetical protein